MTISETSSKKNAYCIEHDLREVLLFFSFVSDAREYLAFHLLDAFKDMHFHFTCKIKWAKNLRTLTKPHEYGCFFTLLKCLEGNYRYLLG